MSAHSAVFELRLEGNEILRYEPGTSRLTDSRGESYSLERARRERRERVFARPAKVGPESPGRKVRTLKKIKISMGLKCNYSCSYCSQAYHRDIDAKKPAPDIDGLVAKIRAVVETEDGAGITFEFWGGEPLVYWPTLKPLAEKIRALYPAARLSMVTNASLLTAEKVSWLGKMNFSVGISHDGPGHHLRGRDPLDHPAQREMIKRLVFELSFRDQINFNCVLSRENPSLSAVYAHIRERLGFDFPLSTEGVVSSYENEKHNLGPRNEEEMRSLWRRVFDDATAPDQFGDPMVTRFVSVMNAVNDFLGSLQDGRPADALGQKCGMDRPDYISFDMNGTVTTCQNVSADSRHAIGSLDSFGEVRLTTAKHWSHHDNCRNCPVVQLCKGSCMFLEGRERKPTCDAHFAFYFGVLSVAMYLLTGKRLESVSADRVRLEGQSSVRF